MVPILNRKKDALKIEKYEREFNRLKEKNAHI
jgi:hypothetical protein